MKYYYEVWVYEDMPMKSLVELAEGMECWKGVRKVTIIDNAELAALREKVERLEDFKTSVEETLELHPSHWESQIKVELEKLQTP